MQAAPVLLSAANKLLNAVVNVAGYRPRIMQNTIKLSAKNQAPSSRIEERLQAAYQAFRNRLSLATADKFFLNATQYLQALTQEGEGSTVLQLRKGLNFTVRRNIWDAESLREVFVERSGFNRLRLGSQPTVVEVGGYIGGFSIYAIKAFRAARVVTYEASADNYRLLSQNIVNNTMEHRITSVNASVDSLESVLKAHELKQVDLLKVDASRDQLDWLVEAPQQLLKQVKRIVLNLPSDGEQAIAPVLKHLTGAGYTLRQDGSAVYASL